MIWLLATLLALVAAGGLAAPWWWPAFAQRRTLRRRGANVAAYRGRLAELDADAASGVVAPDGVEAARAELAARLVQDVAAPLPPELVEPPSRALLAGMLVALFVFAAAWYALAGTWRTQALIDLARTSPELARAQSVDAMVERLRARVADHPDDADAWAWLGRSYRARGNHADAAIAFARASERKGRQDPDLLSEEGEALALAQDRALAGEPAARFAQALALAPEHPQALWYSGLAALQAGDDRGALAHWEKLARLPLPDETRAALEHSLAQLRERAGVAAPAASSKAVGGAVVLHVDVSVAPELASDVRADDTLFVYALDAAGSRVPLAVKRLRAGDLPLRTTLTDQDSMTPQRTLSSVDRWRVIARVSRSGSATGQSGDLEGERQVARGDAGKPFEVVIAGRRP